VKVIFIKPSEDDGGFEQIMWLRCREMIETLDDMGVAVLPVELHAVFDGSEDTLREMREFNADVVIVATLSYFVSLAGRERNLLRLLGKPVIVFWDDPLGALAGHLKSVAGRSSHRNGRLAKIFSGFRAAEREFSASDLFQGLMRNPMVTHFSWDSGHVEVVNALGFTDPRQVKWYPLVTYAPFLETGRLKKDVPQTTEIAFCGNLYLSALKKSRFWKNEFFKSLTIAICERNLQSLDRSVWDVMIEEIEKLPTAARDKHGLHLARREFWDYYLFVAWQAANTLIRLGVLTKIKQEISFYGLFADPKSSDLIKAYPNLIYQGNRDHFTELPRTYASTKINICISNGLCYKGVSSKLLDCLASGGFALTDPKEDLVRIFGDPVKKIFFRNVDELNEKIGYYLDRPSEREEIVDTLRRTIERRCTVRNLFGAVLKSVNNQWRDPRP
jgi:hypothetical protein